MQAWEQQVASLSRQLAKVTSEVEDVQRERHILLDSLRASEQVRPPYQIGSQNHRRYESLWYELLARLILAQKVRGFEGLHNYRFHCAPVSLIRALCRSRRLHTNPQAVFFMPVIWNRKVDLMGWQVCAGEVPSGAAVPAAAAAGRGPKRKGAQPDGALRGR